MGGHHPRLVFYLVLHSVAAQPVVIDAQPGKIGGSIARSVGHTFAVFGQYLLPFVCLVGAVISAWRRKERKNLLANATESKAGDALDGMSWQKFEMLVGEGFRLQGYQVVETGGGGADGGVDLVLTRPGKNGSEKFLVQCKQWRAFKVGVDVVRELYGVMAARGAAGGFVVTSGRFTEEAKNFSSGRNVNLVDGPKLHGLLEQGRAGLDRAPTRTAASPSAAPRAAPDVTAGTAAPSCPLCSKRWCAAPPNAARMPGRSSGAARAILPAGVRDRSTDNTESDDIARRPVRPLADRTACPISFFPRSRRG